LPQEPEVLGSLALTLLTDPRRAARADAHGALVPLDAQDRTRWDRGRIAEGLALVRHCLARNRPGPYQIQAAINAVHSSAPSVESVDWRQVLQLYDQLLAFEPTPVVALHRAVAVAEVESVGAALALIEPLGLDHYHVFHAIRADFLRRLGRDVEAAAAYDAACARTNNAKEREFLMRRREALGI